MSSPAERARRSALLRSSPSTEGMAARSMRRAVAWGRPSTAGARGGGGAVRKPPPPGSVSARSRKSSVPPSSSSSSSSSCVPVCAKPVYRLPVRRSARPRSALCPPPFERRGGGEAARYAPGPTAYRPSSASVAPRVRAPAWTPPAEGAPPRVSATQAMHQARQRAESLVASGVEAGEQGGHFAAAKLLTARERSRMPGTSFAASCGVAGGTRAAVLEQQLRSALSGRESTPGPARYQSVLGPAVPAGAGPGPSLGRRPRTAGPARATGGPGPGAYAPEQSVSSAVRRPRAAAFSSGAFYPEPVPPEAAARRAEVERRNAEGAGQRTAEVRRREAAGQAERRRRRAAGVAERRRRLEGERERRTLESMFRKTPEYRAMKEAERVRRARLAAWRRRWLTIVSLCSGAAALADTVAAQREEARRRGARAVLSRFVWRVVVRRRQAREARASTVWRRHVSRWRLARELARRQRERRAAAHVLTSFARVVRGRRSQTRILHLIHQRYREVQLVQRVWRARKLRRKWTRVLLALQLETVHRAQMVRWKKKVAAHKKQAPPGDQPPPAPAFSWDVAWPMLLDMHRMRAAEAAGRAARAVMGVTGGSRSSRGSRASRSSSLLLAREDVTALYARIRLQCKKAAR